MAVAAAQPSAGLRPSRGRQGARSHLSLEGGWGVGSSLSGGGIIPEGAGFTLLAREDKHSLHMLREHDKGIASLNEKGRGGEGEGEGHQTQ